MVSLIDIGPAKKKVTLREGVDIDVQGVSAMAVFTLLQDYPDLRKVLTGQKLNQDQLLGLIAGIPHAAASVIAYATGNGGNDAEIAAAMGLPVGEQALLLKGIAEVTFPQGVSSFLEGLGVLTEQAGVRGWGQDTKSPAQSSDASAPATPQPTLGDTPPANSPAGQTSSSENKPAAT